MSEQNPLDGVFSQMEQALGQDAYQSQIKHNDAHSEYTASSAKVQEAFADIIEMATNTIAVYAAVVLPAVVIKSLRWAVKK